MIQSYRIRNIEFRETQDLFKEHTYYEIVKWVPKENYVPNINDWEEVADNWYENKKHPNHQSDLTSIMLTEFCYTLSIFEKVNNKYKVINVGNRVRELSKDDIDAYKEVKNFGYDTLMKEI